MDNILLFLGMGNLIVGFLLFSINTWLSSFIGAIGVAYSVVCFYHLVLESSYKRRTKK